MCDCLVVCESTGSSGCRPKSCDSSFRFKEASCSMSIRAGLKNLTQVYALEGYVDMTAGREFEIDEARGAIDMVLKIDQQAQYRYGSIEFLGVNTVTREKFMESLPTPGEVFDGTGLDEF